MATVVADHRNSSGEPDVVDPRRWLLAIDTSTDQAGIALFDGEQLAEYSWPGGRQQTTSVLPAIESLIEQVGVDLGDIGAVSVATGPGSFTGLRVGLSLAKGFAIDGMRSVIGVPTLDIAAAPYRAAHLACIALVPAGRGRVVWSVYPDRGSGGEPANTTFDECMDMIAMHPDSIVVGELAADQRSRLHTIHQHVASEAMSRRRPGILAELGYLRWQLGDVSEVETLEPLYVHGLVNPR